MVRASKPLPASSMTTRGMRRAASGQDAAPGLQSNAAFPQVKAKPKAKAKALRAPSPSTALEFIDIPAAATQGTSAQLEVARLVPSPSAFSLDAVLDLIPVLPRPPALPQTEGVGSSLAGPLTVEPRSRKRAHTSTTHPAHTPVQQTTAVLAAGLATPGPSKHHPLLRSASGGRLAPLSVAPPAAHISPVHSEGVISTPGRRRSAADSGDASFSWDSISSPSVVDMAVESGLGAQVELFLGGIHPAPAAPETPSPFVTSQLYKDVVIHVSGAS